MKTFDKGQLKKGDKILVIELNTEDFYMSSRVANFITDDSFNRIQIEDQGNIVSAKYTPGESISHRLSKNLVSDIYYFSDMERLELFIKDIDEKIAKLREDLYLSLKESWNNYEKIRSRG